MYTSSASRALLSAAVLLVVADCVVFVWGAAVA